MSTLAKVKKAARTNPTTTFAVSGLSLAAVVAVVSRLLGLDWSTEMQTQVTNDILAATVVLTPVFRLAVMLWNKYFPSDDEG